MDINNKLKKLHNKIIDNILQNGRKEVESEYLKSRRSNYSCNFYALSVRYADTDKVKAMLDNYKKSDYGSLTEFCKFYFKYVGWESYVYEVLYDAYEEELIFRCVELVGENKEGYNLRQLTEYQFIKEFGICGLLDTIIMTR